MTNMRHPIPHSLRFILPIHRIAAVAALSVMLLTGCGDSDDAHGRGPGEKGASRGGHPGGAKAAMPEAAVAVSLPRRGTIASYYTANASLDPNRQAEVVARVSGVVLDITTEEGKDVRRDATLLAIDDREYRQRLRLTDAEVSRQRARFERMKKMVEGDLVSADEYEGARSDVQSAEANQALAALELSYTKVKSPFSGRVVQRYVDPGQMVTENTPLFLVADISTLLARVHVPSREFRNIRTDQKVELRVDSNGEVLPGRIVLVSPVIDPAAGTIKVTVEVDDYPGTIRPGDFAEVRIVTDLHENTLLVPKNAVISEKGEQVVFLAKDGAASRRVVKTGFQDDTNAEIISGVDEGDQVIVQGQRSLREGQPLKILEAMTFDNAGPGRKDS